MKEKTLLERLLEAGYPKEDVFHHASDLYVYATPLTERIIEEWCKEHGYNQSWHCPTFKDQVTGKMMFDCAFNYYDIDAEKERERKKAIFDDLMHGQYEYIVSCGGILCIREADDTYNGMNLKVLEAFNDLYDDGVFLGSIARGVENPGLKKYKLPVYNFSCDLAVPRYDSDLDNMLKDYSAGSDSITIQEIQDRVEDLGGYHIVWF